jgi:hypothetical protein
MFQLCKLRLSFIPRRDVLAPAKDKRGVIIVIKKLRHMWLLAVVACCGYLLWMLAACGGSDVCGYIC